jgi:hypothetical protein
MGLTFDTGALIGLERSRQLMRKVYDTAISNDVPIVVPAVVIAEWWRTGTRTKLRAELLRSMRVEPLTDSIARLAGAALTLVPTAGTIDAIVMASAAMRPREVVYTSDPDDLEALRDNVAAFASILVDAVGRVAEELLGEALAAGAVDAGLEDREAGVEADEDLRRRALHPQLLPRRRRRRRRYREPWTMGERRFIANANPGATMQHRRAYLEVPGRPNGRLVKRWPAGPAMH